MTAPLLGRRALRLGQPRLLLVAVLAVLVIWPLGALLLRAFADGADGYRRMFDVPDFGQIVANTVGLAIGSVIIAVFVGAGLAWCVSRAPRRVRGWLGLIPLLPLIMPAVASTTGWIFLLTPRVGYINVLLRKLPFFDHLVSGPIDIFGMPGIILLTGFSLVGFVYLYVRTSMEAIGSELEDAAAICGASPLRVFRTVTLPLIRPALIYSAGIAMLLGVGQFTNPLLLGRPKNVNVITTVMYGATIEFPVDYALGAALASPLLVIGAVIMLLQRTAVGNQSRYVVVTGKSNFRQTKGTWWAVPPVLLFAVVAVILPVMALLLVAMSPFWSGTIDWGGLGFDNIQKVLGDPKTTAAVGTSVRAILSALVVVVPLGFAAALVLRQARDRLNSVIDLFTVVPLTMPAAIFGFAILYSYAGGPFSLYGTTTIIVLAYTTLMIPHAVRPQLAAMMSIGTEYAEASRVSGAGRVRTIWKVEIPLVRSGIAVAVALVVVLLFHEFSASMMVRTARTQVMGTLLYDFYTSGLYPSVAVVALLMVVITTVGVALALAVGGRRALQN